MDTCDVELMGATIHLTQMQRALAADLLAARRSDFECGSTGTVPVSLPVPAWSELREQVAASLAAGPGTTQSVMRLMLEAIDQSLKIARARAADDSGVDSGVVLRVRIELLTVEPPVWRTVEVPPCTLAELHVVIQHAMGWSDSYLHEFDVNGKSYATINSCDEWNEDADDAAEVTLLQLLNDGVDSFSYVYDFRDGWDHDVILEDMTDADPQVSYPRCIAGERNAPPEDSGGPAMYLHRLTLPRVADGVQFDSEDCLSERGLPAGFEPEEFDVSLCDQKIREGWDEQIGSGDSEEDPDFRIDLDLFADGELDDDALIEWCEQIEIRFEKSPEFQELGFDHPTTVCHLIELGPRYLGVPVTEFSVPNLREILFDIIPRKVMVKPEHAGAMIAELNAFFRFLGREFHVQNARKLADELDEYAADELAECLGDRSNFGMAKSLMTQAVESGFDVTSEEGLQQFIAHYNRNLAKTYRPQPVVDDHSYVPPVATIRATKRPGRNDPCPCGSGRKYKRCCLDSEADD